MNWVAHLLLSGKNKDIITGNWLGDSVKGQQYLDYPPTIQKGILLHREIDSFTDSHPTVKEATRLLHKSQSKFSPIVIDLVFDYYLIKNWEEYVNITFEGFCQWHYNMISQIKDQFPPKLKNFTEKLIEYNWFNSYSTLDGIKDVLQQMSQRSKYPNNMDEAIHDIKEHYDTLNQLFLDFFPEIQKMAWKYLEK